MLSNDHHIIFYLQNLKKYSKAKFSDDQSIIFYLENFKQVKVSYDQPIIFYLEILRRYIIFDLDHLIIVIV